MQLQAVIVNSMSMCAFVAQHLYNYTFIVIILRILKMLAHGALYKWGGERRETLETNQESKVNLKRDTSVLISTVYNDQCNNKTNIDQW